MFRGGESVGGRMGGGRVSGKGGCSCGELWLGVLEGICVGWGTLRVSVGGGGVVGGVYVGRRLGTCGCSWGCMWGGYLGGGSWMME